MDLGFCPDERRGGSTVIGITADAMARNLGFPGYQYVTLQHPIASRTEAEIDELVRDALADILRVLGAGLSSSGGALTAPEIDGAEVRRVIEYYYEQGWTDGLPVMPVTQLYD